MKYQEYDRKDIHSLLFSFWDTRVSILLSARSVFIAIVTVIFSVGVYLASLETRGTNIFLREVVCVLGIILAILWRLICVDLWRKQHYFRWRLLQFEKGKYSSEKVCSDYMNFKFKKKRNELLRDCEWKQSEPKWLPTKVLNTWLPYLFIGLFIYVLIAPFIIIKLRMFFDLPPKNWSSYYVRIRIKERGDLDGQKKLQT